MRPVDPRLLREAPAARRFLVVATGLAVILAVATIVQAAALGRLVAAVLLGHAGLRAVTPELVALAVATCVRAALAWALESGGRLAAIRSASQLRAKLLSHLLVARPGGVHDTPAGEIAASAVPGLDALEPYFARFLPQLVLSAVVPVLILGWVAWHDAESAVVMAVTLPLIPVFGALVGKVTATRALRRFSILSVLAAHFLDVVRGLPTLRAFNRGQAATIAQVSDDYRRETMATLRIGFLSALVLELAATLSTAVIAVEIGIRLVDGHIALAPALAVLVLAPEYYAPLRNAAAQFHAAADGLAAAGRIFELLDLTPSIAVSERPQPLPDVRRSAIRFDDVSLTYPERPAPVLEGFNAVLRPGERVALSGPSGAGKSSLLALLLRFHDPSSGRILVGDVELATTDPEEWRRRLGWLPQRPRLRPGRLRDALAPGSATDAELWTALERVSAVDVVAGLPGGLDAVLGERTPLSAGEARRLALARALAGGGEIFLLDEPTTHLDPVSALRVVEAIAALPGDALVVCATHDERLLAAADRVVALGGRVRGMELGAVA